MIRFEKMFALFAIGCWSDAATTSAFDSHREDLMQDRPPRRMTSSRDAAEAMFKAVTTKPPEGPAIKRPAVPGVREQVTLRLDRVVLDYFQAGGPGWQDRINDALLRIATG